MGPHRDRGTSKQPLPVGAFRSLTTEEGEWGRTGLRRLTRSRAIRWPRRAPGAQRPKSQIPQQLSASEPVRTTHCTEGTRPPQKPGQPRDSKDNSQRDEAIEAAKRETRHVPKARPLWPEVRRLVPLAFPYLARLCKGHPLSSRLPTW